MNDSQLHEIHAAAESLGVKPYERKLAVDRLIADGRARRTEGRGFELTAEGLEWLGRVAVCG